MLEKPDLPDERLIACLHEAYGLPIDRLEFLPIGNDVDTAVYRAVAHGGTPYFLKLRRGALDEATIRVPRLLADQGMTQVISPLETAEGQLWARVDPYTVILYPYVPGHTGFGPLLTEPQWVELGLALKRLHTATVPDDLRRAIATEAYGPRWRDHAREFQARAEVARFGDSIAAEFAAFVRDRREEITHLIERAEQLGDALRASPPANVLCHGDIHAWNVLIDASGALYVVDWDTLIFAPKERDLMFIGGGVGAIWSTLREEALFYQGYGPAEIDAVALVYYRYERIVEDVAAFSEEILDATVGGADRAKGARLFMSAFLPGDMVQIARETDRRLLRGVTPNCTGR